ncbi:hypothetical protein RQP46_007399 [Phenoliferia psychrophenolica]
MGALLAQHLPSAIQQVLRTDLALLVAAAGLAFVFLIATHWDGRAIGTKRRPDLATVPGIPLLGNLLFLIKHGERHMENMTAFRKANPDQNKTISLTVPGRRIIDITKPSWIEYVQKTNFPNFEKGPRAYENLHGVLGDGIFVVDGEAWKIQRKATSKIFSTNNFRGFITTSIQSEIEKLKIIIGFALMAFGRNIGALSLETDAPVPFASALDYAQGVMNKRFGNPLWRVAEALNGDKNKMAEATKVMDDFVFDIISQREAEGLGNITSDDKKGKASEDLLSLYMALRDENGKPLTRRALRDSVLNLIIAGRDTTAQGLAWTWFHLLTRPSILASLREEVDTVKVVDYDSYKTLVETQAVFQEGLRLHPSVPKNVWRTIADDHIPEGGPLLHANDSVHWSDWELGRDTSVWGPDAATFRPSRWIDEKRELKKESQWKAHFFNGGARLCLGQTLAVYEATSVIAAIVRDFDLELAPGYLDTSENTFATQIKT